MFRFDILRFRMHRKSLALLLDFNFGRIYRAFEKYPAKMKRQKVGNLLSRKT